MSKLMSYLTLLFFGLVAIGCYALYKWFMKKFGKYLP